MFEWAPGVPSLDELVPIDNNNNDSRFLIHKYFLQINDKCKIIFPSTHVIYEGIEKVKNNIIKGFLTTKIEYLVIKF